MDQPRPATTIRKTPNFDFIFGRYSHSQLHVPYFQVSMSFDDIARYLVLVTEMPGASSMNWRIEELFQRDIDWRRVERKIVPYLKQQEEPHFFNSLTIALLPFHGDTVGDFSASKGWHAPELENQQHFPADRVRRFGPVTCGYWGGWSDPIEDNARLGQICWNTNEVCAVAIDGQHRLAAIKELGQAGTSSSVPVILIVLHPDLGFPRSGRQSVIDTLRRLFIDLNKHAQTVSRARQILLDDRDPVSICVRAIIGDQLVEGKAELEETLPRLPLSLVDWHTERALFGDGPYLATILGMDWAVSKILAIRPFEDPMAHDEIDRLIGRLEKNLGLDLEMARQRLKECDRHKRPFSFVEEPVDELRQIADGFRSEWSKPVTTLLTQMVPYRKLIDVRATYGTLSPEFCNWFALKASAESAKGAAKATALLLKYENELANRLQNPIAGTDLFNSVTECEKVKDRYPLAFAVVFHRALFLAFVAYTKVTRQIVAVLGDEDAIEIDAPAEEVDEEAGTVVSLQEERASRLVEALNTLIVKEPGFLEPGFEFPCDEENETFDRFWLCSFQDPQGPIDFTQGAAVRASDLLLLVGHFWIYHKIEGLGQGDFEKLMERAETAESGLDLKLDQCLNRLFVPEQSIGARICKMRGDSADAQDDDKKWAVMKPRVAWLWNSLVG